MDANHNVPSFMREKGYESERRFAVFKEKEQKVPNFAFIISEAEEAQDHPQEEEKQAMVIGSQ